MDEKITTQIQRRFQKLEFERNRWLDFYKNNPRFKKADQNVLKFISKVSFFPDRDCIENNSIDHLFCAGYCFYFANMLKIAFNRGTVCWSVNRGHIVWLDGTDTDNDIAYDITGIYYDYEELRPVEYLGGLILDYMHNGQEWVSEDSDFHEWCKSKCVNDAYAIDEIWYNIPKSILAEYDEKSMNFIEAALDYWHKNVDKFEYITERKKIS